MKILKYCLLVFLSTGLLLTSCTTEKQKMEEHHFQNKLYVNFTEAVTKTLVKPDGDDTIVKNLSVSTALPVTEVVSGKFVANTAALDTFKEGYGMPEAVLLPEDCYTIENADVKIEVGSVTSTNASVKFTGVRSYDLNTLFVLPVSLVDVQGIEVLSSKTTVYYVFKGADLINVVCNMTDNRAAAQYWKEDCYQGMRNFTLEFLVNMTTADKLISTVMGVEGHFLLRFGDSGVPGNQLQVAGAMNLTNEDLQVELGKWTHFAVVFNMGQVQVYKNGLLKLEGDCGRFEVNFNDYEDDKAEVNNFRAFWLGYSYNHDRSLDGMLSEVRIWNRCLTQEEIQAKNHFYSVPKSSEGLIAYWKCDDAAGKVIKDYSPMGNDLELDDVPTWVNVVLPEK